MTAQTTGKPIWVDLGTSDLEAAKTFYSGLFGWKAETNPDPQFGGYTLFTLNGETVAGGGPLMGPGQPTAWSTYIGVDDVDATSKAVEAAGGKVLVPVMDIPGQGRMAVFLDSAGAAISAWQPMGMTGATVFNTPGALCWNELSTGDAPAAKEFYGKVFGWQASDNPMGEQTYTEFQLGGRSIAGMMPMADSMKANGVPPHWMVYFAVADCDAATTKAKQLGAKIMMPGTNFPGGRFAVMSDPTGAAFAIVHMTEQNSNN